MTFGKLFLASIGIGVRLEQYDVVFLYSPVPCDKSQLSQSLLSPRLMVWRNHILSKPPPTKVKEGHETE